MFEDLNLLDPSTWLWGSALIILVTFIAIYFKVFLSRREP